MEDFEISSKAYYAVIPANVRYDTDIMASAKLLYGEITALCNDKGFCWATNRYFATLYKVSTRSIQSWINSLVAKGYIKVELEKKNDGTKEVCRRIMWLHDPMKKTSWGYEENFVGVGRNLRTPHEENFVENNTVNITSNITKNRERAKPSRVFKAPSVDEVRAYIQEKGYNIDPVQFVNYFEANDWKDSKGNKVKSWKQKVITWASYHRNNSPAQMMVAEEQPKPKMSYEEAKARNDALLRAALAENDARLKAEREGKNK